MKNKVKNKKGFTLAELLVVLAILAVLVAVAVPLFTGAIGSAKDTAINANYRAVRVAAVTEILTNESIGKNGPWSASASIAADGGMTNLHVEEVTTAPADAHTDVGADGVSGTYTVGITKLTTT